MCCSEYTAMWLKLLLSLALGTFDLYSDLNYYLKLPSELQTSPPGWAWLARPVAIITGGGLFVSVVVTRLTCMNCVLRRPDDFDKKVPTEKNLRLDFTVLMFDVSVLFLEDIPQFVLLLILQQDGWTLSAILSMLSIMMGFALMTFTAFYLCCCCTTRSTLLRFKTCALCCKNNCGKDDWKARYQSTRKRLEAAKETANRIKEGAVNSAVAVKNKVDDLKESVQSKL